MLLRILNYLNFNIHSGQHEILISTFSETSELSTFDLFFFFNNFSYSSSEIAETSGFVLYSILKSTFPL